VAQRSAAELWEDLWGKSEFADETCCSGRSEAEGKSAAVSSISVLCAQPSAELTHLVPRNGRLQPRVLPQLLGQAAISGD
jgi:hypothetical protein